MKFEELLAREHREGELEGKIEGKLEWIFEVLKKFDHVPEDITASIKSIDDIDKLDKLFQLALKAEVPDDFVVEATKVIS
ncbi:MAG: hypothetical protein E7266_00160 [Lachnospiraceae bacterium]|nr:hypothetical protein [Lachnospiraceae bacterium]